MNIPRAWLRRLAPFSLVISSCGGGDGGATQSQASGCEPGATSSCACSDGSTSTQVCQSDGSFGACECVTSTNPTDPASPAPSGTPDPLDPTDPAPTDPPPTDPTDPVGTGGAPTDPPPTDPVDPVDPVDPPPPPPAGTSGCGASTWAPEGNGTMDVDGISREYIVTLPPNYDPNVPYKVVFVWHPLGGDMASIADYGYMGFEAASAGTTIFATGQGLYFAGGTLRGWGDPNDIPFAKKLLDHITANYCVDGERIFSTGFSFGAIMSNRVGCEMGDRVRAIAPMSGGGPRPTPCVGNVAVWITHGDQDSVVPYSSGLDSLDYWVTANTCSTTTVPNGVDACVEYQGCLEGHPVVWCPTHLDHTPPSYYTTEIWSFFSRF